MTAILGISAFYHDSAAALVRDGTIVAAAQEERFTRRKHDHRFPKHAVDYCLQTAGLSPEALDFIGFYEKPLTKFERLLETSLAFVPRGYRSFRQSMPRWLKEKLHVAREMRTGLGGRYRRRFVFLDHHQSHAASAFFPSPFDEAAILTMDAVGEWSTTCFGTGQGHQLHLTREIRFPHSLGLLYSAFTYYAGFRVNSGEYKLMGLAPFGQPVFKERILNNLIDLKADGSYRLDQSYFRYCQGLTMTSPKFHRLFGGPPRQPDDEIRRRDMDLAASIQAVTEEIVLRTARHVHRETGLPNLVLAGGVALNSVANGRLLREGPFDQIWIQPAAGDAGGALGTALFIWHHLLGNARTPNPLDSQQGSFLGPAFSEADIRRLLNERQAVYDAVESDQELCDRVADLIADQKVVGWFQGRMEFGPRALGARSILADARNPAMQSVLNSQIKFRESFRPFAPIVLREHASRYFEIRTDQESPYMAIVAPVREEIRQPPDPGEADASGLAKLRQRRSSIPAVTHVDYSARIQTVDRMRHPLLHRLLESFHRKTGCPVLINTSFNVRGEPVVCTPAEAYECFMATDMDFLVLGRSILAKGPQKKTADERRRRRHLISFQPD